MQKVHFYLIIKTLKATNDIKIKTARKLESENTIKILKNKQSGVTPLGSFIYKSYYNKCKKNSNKIVSLHNIKL